MVLFTISDDGQRPSNPPLTVSREKTPLKLEIEDSLDDEHGPFNKKQKQSSSNQFPSEVSSCQTSNSQYNPLEDPSPLGLRLRKSPSLLELIQMSLSQGKSSTLGSLPNNDSKTQEKVNTKSSVGGVDKLKASNFPASFLKIGSWEYTSRYEGDLVAKCYFAKHKLVWEILEGGLKSKIEIQWSDIMGLKADFPNEESSTLIVVLARQPLFFRETNPQPRKHTLWQATADFTDRQASLHRKHLLKVPHGLLNKHFEKLIQCDTRLNFLSRQPEVTMDSPYFESQPSVFDNSNESKNPSLDKREISRGSSVSIFEDVGTPSISQTSSRSINLEDALHGVTEVVSRETASPSSVMDTRLMEVGPSSESDKTKGSKSVEHLIMQGLRPSMSMTDLLNHIEKCISENPDPTDDGSGSRNVLMQGIRPSMSVTDLVNHIENCISENPDPTDDGSGSQNVLADIAQHLLGDFQPTPCSDEKSLMSRVNSLCSLLQKDGNPIQSSEVTEQGKAVGTENYETELKDDDSNKNDVNVPESSRSIPRIDSFGDLLHHLPRIASLPKFLFDISEDGDNQAR